MDDWLFKQTGYGRQEASANFKLVRDLKEARRGDKVGRGDFQLLLPPAGRALCAANKFGRVLWAEAFCLEFSRYFKLGPGHSYPDQPIYLVTIVDYRCMTAHDAREVDPAPFIAHLRKALEGISCIGMLDVGYYTNIAHGARYKNKKALSWHIHVIAWGRTPKQMDLLMERLNSPTSGFQSIGDGLEAFHSKRIPKSESKTYHLADKLAYLLKSGKHAYRLGKREIVTPDGEIIPTFYQRKTLLRRGERIRLFQATKHLYLDRIAIAGGEGAAILRRVKRRALRHMKPVPRIRRSYSHPSKRG